MVKIKKSGKSLVSQYISLKKHFKDIQKGEARIGYFDSKVHEGFDFTLASLMQLLHDGFQGIPARPVFRKTLDKISIRDKKLLNETFERYLSSPREVLLMEIAKVLKIEIQSQFGVGNDIGLAPNVMPNKKGRNDPLVDSGELRDKMEARVD